jgi:F0F1-type ATP synthase membrane subunit a
LATEAHNPFAHSPMAQFEIHRFIPMQAGGVDVSFTNSSLFMVIALTAITLFLSLAARRWCRADGSQWPNSAMNSSPT